MPDPVAPGEAIRATTARILEIYDVVEQLEDQVAFLQRELIVLELRGKVIIAAAIGEVERH